MNTVLCLWKRNTYVHAYTFMHKQGQLSGKIHKRHGDGCSSRQEDKYTHPRGCFISSFLRMLVTLKSRTKDSWKKSRGRLPIHWVSTKPPIFPNPLMNPLAYPRGSLENRSQPSCCAAPAFPSQVRGAQQGWLQSEQWTGQRTLCAFPPAPAELQDWPLQLQSLRAFPTQPTELQGKCSPRITC